MAKLIPEAAGGPRARRAGRSHGEPEACQTEDERQLLQETALETETMEEWGNVQDRFRNLHPKERRVPLIFQCALSFQTLAVHQTTKKSLLGSRW